MLPQNVPPAKAPIGGKRLTVSDTCGYTCPSTLVTDVLSTETMNNQVVEAEVVAEAETEAPVAGEVLQDGDDLTSGCEGVLGYSRPSRSKVCRIHSQVCGVDLE